MKLRIVIGLAIVLALASGAEARPRFLSTAEVADIMAELHAYGDNCRNWSEDSDATMVLFVSNELKTDDRYRVEYAKARAKHWPAANRLMPREACSIAVERFGPHGRRAPGLLKLK